MASWIVAANALAQGRFDVPERCGTRVEFEQQIASRVGADAPEVLEKTDLRIAAEDSGYRLTLGVGTEHRELTDLHCEDLLRAAVVIIVSRWQAPAQRGDGTVEPTSRGPADAALGAATEDQAASGMGAPAAENAHSVGKPRSMTTVSAVTSPRGSVALGALPRHPESSWQIGAEVGIGYGMQPNLGPVLGLRVAHEYRAFGLATRLRGLPANEQRDANGRGVSVAGLGGSIGGYYRATPWLNIEAGLSCHYLHGRGLGSTNVDAAGVVALGPTASAWVTPWWSDSVFTAIGAEAHVDLLRPRFEILEYGQVFRVATLGATAFMAAGYHFR